jgi:hypothetical protein
MAQELAMAPTTCDGGVQFSGDFESGNLDRAVRVSEDEYDLFLRPDTLNPR